MTADEQNLLRDILETQKLTPHMRKRIENVLYKNAWFTPQEILRMKYRAYDNGRTNVPTPKDFEDLINQLENNECQSMTQAN